MKNADDMLREIIDIVDVNGDGKIQFEGGGSKRLCLKEDCEHNFMIERCVLLLLTFLSFSLS